MRSEVFTAMKMWTVVFWVMKPCSLVSGRQHFEGTNYKTGRGYNPVYDSIIDRIID
jgi:hypothetical protein